MVKIKLVNYQIEEKWLCTEKQFRYISGLMSKPKYQVLFLNTLAFDGRERLSISEASKLIQCLVDGKDFEIVDEKDNKQTKFDLVG